MFGLFKKKSRRQVLEKQYRQLMEEYHRLSHTDRKASDEKYAEADRVMKELEQVIAEEENNKK